MAVRIDMNKGCTIFIPVYNEADRVEKAIRGAAPQCERLLVSDNASTDGTESVCRGLLAEYPNIEYFRQQENIGAMNNWLFLLKRVETPYVMALGSHDSINESCVERLLSTLENHADTELAAPELFFEQDTEITRDNAFSDWRGGELSDARARVQACIFDKVNLGWTAYGLFRTQWLKEILLGADNPPYGADIIQLAKTALKGKIRVVQGAHYLAWVRGSGHKGAGYVERLLGHDKARSERLAMRNEFRRALFDVYLSANRFDSHWQRLAARYRYMVRIGMFKAQAPDYGFYLLYLPVKLSRRLIRGV